MLQHAYNLANHAGAGMLCQILPLGVLRSGGGGRILDLFRILTFKTVGMLLKH
jgi:hypothetical protein